MSVLRAPLLAWIPRIGAFFAIAAGLSVLAGWTLDLPLLRSVVPGAVEMKANTALALLADGVVLWVLTASGSERSNRIARTLALMTVALGIATLVEYAFALDLGIDEFFFQDRAAAYNLHRGRMSPYSALAFVTLGLALFGLKRAGPRWLTLVGAFAGMGIGVVSALGYLWNAQELVTDRLVPPVAINTAVVFMLLGIGIMAAHSRWRASARVNAERRPLESLMVVAVVAFLLLLVTGGSYSYRAIAHFDTTLAADERVDEVRTALFNLQLHLAEALAAQRAHLVTGASFYSDRFRTHAAEARANLAMLRTAPADAADPSIVRLIDARVVTYLDTLEQEIATARDGHVGAREIIENSSAGSLRKTIATLDDPIEARQARFAAERRADASRLRQFTLAALLLLVMASAIVAWALLRAIRRDFRTQEEGRHLDGLARNVLTVLATTRTRAEALAGTLELLAPLSPGCSVAFYAPTPDGGFELQRFAGARSDWSPRPDPGEYLIGKALESSDVVLGGGGSVFRLACRVTHRDQDFGVITMAASRAFRGQEQAFVQRKAAHLAVALSNLQHYAELSELSAQLRRKNEVLQRQAVDLGRANRMKSEFLATMSHELRTPLNAIIGFAEVLRENLVGELTDEQREYVGDIFTSGEHLLSLINDILDLSKVEAGKMELELDAVDPVSLLQGSLTMVRERAASRRIRLTLVAEPGLDVIEADARRLKQIVYNLIANAVKFSHDGGEVRIAVSRVQSPDPVLQIQVSDTGIGIAPEDQARLFQPFVQIDGSLAKRFEGSGLGLVLVKRLTELHGGSVQVVSAPGQGSTFTVCIPYRAVEVAADAGTPSSTSVAVARTRPLVLVVEDQDADAELLRVQIEHAGMEVVRAPDAETGLRMARELQPDVITADVLMTDKDGWDFLTGLKADATLARIPVIVISVVADSRKGLALGAAAVLQKPVAAAEIGSAFEALSLMPALRHAFHALVVDDDPMAGQIIGSYLESIGGCVTRAHGGAEGIAQARSARPDLLVVDLLMPGASGFEVIGAVRADPSIASTPIIVVTGKPLTSEERSVLDSENVRVLHKGEFRRAELLEHVRELVAA